METHSPTGGILTPREIAELRRLSRVFGSIAGLEPEASRSFEKGLLASARREPELTAQMVREGKASYRIASRLQPDPPVPHVLHIEAGTGPDAEPLWLFARVEKLVRRTPPTDRLTVVITGLDRIFVGPGRRWSEQKRRTNALLRTRLENLVCSTSPSRIVTIVFA